MRAIEFLLEAAYDSLVLSMKTAKPDQAENIGKYVKWAKAALVKSDRVTWYLRIMQAWLSGNDTKLKPLLGDYPPIASWDALGRLGEEIQHFLGIQDAKIQNYAFVKQPVSQVITELGNLEREWAEREAAKPKPVKAQGGDHVLFDFGGGLEWWYVDRAYCDEEGRSGAHCGNVVGQRKKDQRILSLRKNGHVLLTFILEPDGSLGEMKAKGNQKPAEKYHPQIIKLLMWDKVTGISGMGYLPDANFSVFDLNEKYLDYVDQHKPGLIADQLKITPFDLLKQPDHIRKQYADQVPELADLINNPSHENWERLIESDAEKIIYAPHDLPDFEGRLIRAFRMANDSAELMLKCPETISRNRELLHTIVKIIPLAIYGVVPAMADADLWVTALLAANTSVTLSSVPDNLLDEMQGAFTRRVQKDPDSFFYVPAELRNEDMCIIAAKEFSEALMHIYEWQATERVYIAAVSSHDVLGMVREKYRTAPVCLAAVKHDGASLRLVPDDVRDEAICLAAVSNNGLAVKHVPDDVLNDAISLAAVKQPGCRALRLLPKDFRTETVCMAAVKNMGGQLSDIPDHVVTEDMCIASFTNADKDALLLDILSLPEHMKTLKVYRVVVSKWRELYGEDMDPIVPLIPDDIKPQLGL